MSEAPDNPNAECNECGNRDWSKYTTQDPPQGYPDDSDVSKHFYTCDDCGADGFIFEENGVLIYSGALRGSKPIA